MNEEAIKIFDESIAETQKKMDEVYKVLTATRKEILSLKKEMRDKKKAKSMFLGEKPVKKKYKKKENVQSN